MSFNRIIFSLLLIALLAAPGFCYTLSGSISGAEFLGGISYVYAFRVDTLSLTPYIGLTLLGNGPYWIFNAPAGSYVLLAFQDRDGNLIPSIDDRFGFYGDTLPAIVEVTGNTNNLDIQVEALPVTSISGNLSCPAGPFGLTLIQAATDPAFDDVAATGFLLSLDGNGRYSLFIEPGTYYLAAFLDADFTFTRTSEDPQTYWGAPNNPLPVNVTSQSVDNINLTLMLPPNVTLALTPQGTPIVVPPGGGTFTYGVNIANNDPAGLSTKIWSNLTLPNGNTQPVLAPLSLTLPGNSSLTRTRTQTIPSSAPAGNYSFNAFLGLYPVIVWQEDSFPFSKSGVGDGSLGGWFNTETEAVSLQPSAFALIGAAPNPFNPTTAISYRLASSTPIHMTVHDVQGRLVTTLVDGMQEAGQHSVTFDGSMLSSCMYFVRMQAGSFTAVQKLMLLK